MNPICALCDRDLALGAIQGSATPLTDRLNRHLEKCQSCRLRFQRYTRLTAGLEELAQYPAVSSAYPSAVFARIDSALRESNAQMIPRLAWAGAVSALFLAAALWIAPRRIPDTSPANLAAPAAQTPVPTLVARSETTPRTTTARVKNTPVPARKVKRKRRIHRIKPRPILRMAAAAAQPTPKVEAAQGDVNLRAKTEKAVPVNWAQIGFAYEIGDDPYSALGAYSRAFEQQPTAGLAYSAGRAAESAGELATAVEFYARALEPAAQPQENPEKGTVRCIDTRSSA